MSTPRSRALLAVFVPLMALVPVVIAARGHADSINSPNLSMDTDTNRSTGPGAGGVFVTVNTLTLAETQLNEYSAGAGKRLVFRVQPGLELDPTSDVSRASSAAPCS